MNLKIYLNVKNNTIIYIDTIVYLTKNTLILKLI